MRRLAAPNDELKRVQRLLLRRVFAKLAVHPMATGFRKGRSYVDNARCHESQAVVISFDLVDFFPSISRQRVVHYLRSIGWNRKVSEALADLTTRKGALPQGAPTSPILSNLVNFKMDHNLACYASSRDGVYSRYADDVTISFSDNHVDTYSVINDVIAILSYWGYRPHLKKKLDVRRSHQRQMVTGLVVNETARLPRETRRWLRAVRFRHQQITSGVCLSVPPSLTPEQLAGWSALESMIDRRPD